VSNRDYDDLRRDDKVTFVLTICGKKSIWMMADQRLSKPPRVVSDNASKILSLETLDGVALVGYSGLGATAKGTEPSEWMARVLRGQNLTLIDSVDEIVRAMNSQFPRHGRTINRQVIYEHQVLILAYVDKHPRRMLIVYDKNIKQFIRIDLFDGRSGGAHPALATGSGAAYLVKVRDGNLFYVRGPNARKIKSLINMVKAADNKRISYLRAADCFSELNWEVHCNVRTVGPNCLVMWRNLAGGGAFQFYKGLERVQGRSPSAVTNGMELMPIIDIIGGHFERIMQETQGGRVQIDYDMDKFTAMLNIELSRLPSTPDDNLE